MYHSITFGDKNTWDDWHLIPTSRPVFNPPLPKVITLDIPGADGVLDFSEALTGYPVYHNREGSFEFIVANGYHDWHTLYSTIMNYLHGKTLNAYLEDDEDYYYEGRFSVNAWKSNNNGTGSYITIDYTVRPYKLYTKTSIDGWLWDPFNFETGTILPAIFSKIQVDSDAWIYKTFGSYIGRMPVTPVFIVSSTDGNGILVSEYNQELKIYWKERRILDGTWTYPEFILSAINEGNNIQMRFRGHGTISIKFRKGGL